MRRYLSGLRISRKILISSLVFALPILVLLYYVVIGFNHHMSFSRQEIWGMRLVDPLQRLSELVSEHQIMVRLYIEGDRQIEQRIEAVSSRIDEAFGVLMREGRILARPLKVDQKDLAAIDMAALYYPTIHQNWLDLKASWKSFDNTIQNDGRHDTILQPIQALVKRVGDTSNMVLDPDLTTTYLIDVALATLPKTQERLSAYILYVESLLFKGFRSRDDLNRLAVYSAFLENDLSRIRESLTITFRDVNGFYGGSRTLQKNVAPALAQYESALVEFLVIGKLMGADPQYRIPTKEFLETARRAVDAEAALREASMKELGILLTKRIASFRNKATLALCLSLGTLFFAVTMVLFIARGITRPLKKVAQIARDVAEGNLQKASESLEMEGSESRGLTAGQEGLSVTSQNEVLQLYQAVTVMTSNLDSLLAQVRKSGIQVSSSSTEIAASARQLEATAAEQAASISEVSATSKEISATAQDFALRMNSVTAMATNAAELAGASIKGLGDIKASMQTLLESTSRSSEKLNAISERMGNIGQVITTITKVANQINLLSLNAAIEAEKAGEYGIGFSVVAREIRRLADQTAVAAIEIEAMITETQESVRDGITTVESYTDRTRASTANIADISVHLERVIGHTQELRPHLEAVNQGMHMQSESASQISEAMSQLNETARQTRDSLVEFKEVTQQLNDAVRGLQEEVARFTVSS